MGKSPMALMMVNMEPLWRDKSASKAMRHAKRLRASAKVALLRQAAAGLIFQQIVLDHHILIAAQHQHERGYQRLASIGLQLPRAGGTRRKQQKQNS